MNLKELQNKIGSGPAYVAAHLADKIDIATYNLTVAEWEQIYANSPAGSELQSKALENIGKFITE